MKVFKDALGREWSYQLNILTVKQIKGATGIDLTQPHTALPVINDDGLTFSDILWALVKKDAEKRGITQEQFLEGLYGNALVEARDGFYAEWIDFFPRSRDAFRAFIERTRDLNAKLQEQCVEEIEREYQRLTTPEAIQAMLRERQERMENAEPTTTPTPGN